MKEGDSSNEWRTYDVLGHLLRRVVDDVLVVGKVCECHRDIHIYIQMEIEQR
jgi:hypothetical protein